MKNMLARCAILYAACAGTASLPANAQHEIMMGWQNASATPSQSTLVWSDAPSLPAAAVTDLTDLRAAVVALGHSTPALLTSSDGRSVAAAEAKQGADSAAPSGVRIWPDWRVANRFITFSDMSQVKYLSNNHVLLSQHPEYGPYVSFVVDIRHANTRFQFAGYQLDTLRVTDSGAWAALALDGGLVSGQLDPSGPSGSITGASVPTSSAVRNLIWRQDGQYLLVELDGPVLHALAAGNWTSVSSISGGLGPDKRNVNPAGRDSCFGYQPATGGCVFTVSNSGAITATQWPHHANEEVGLFVSPFRKFVITQSRDASGFVLRHCRKTPDALASDTIPAFPAVPQGTKIQGFGWLQWSP